MPRGGRRTGTPGTPYGNRSDLRALPVTTVPGQPYGLAGEQAAAQRAVPMAPAPAPVAAPPQGQQPPPPQGPPPGFQGAFDRPSERPNEPIQAGLPMGPGPGPEALGTNPQGATVGDALQRLALSPYASGEIRSLLQKVSGP